VGEDKGKGKGYSVSNRTGGNRCGSVHVYVRECEKVKVSVNEYK